MVEQLGNNEVTGTLLWSNLKDVMAFSWGGGGLRKYMKNLSQGSCWLDQVCNLEPPGYETGMLIMIITFSNFNVNWGIVKELIYDTVSTSLFQKHNLLEQSNLL